MSLFSEYRAKLTVPKTKSIHLLSRITILLLGLAGYQSAWGQTTYYVATNGTDANDGRSMASPFQSLAKVNTLTLRAGDAVLLRRGDTFRGTLSIKQSGSAGSPIVVDAYGSGNKPIIAGSTILSGWSRNGNVWQASCSACGRSGDGGVPECHGYALRALP